MDEKWVEIDDEAILVNLASVRSLLAEHTRLIAVVKANAYGHGLVPTARLLEGNGVGHFAVTFLSEAIELRQAGINGTILLLSPLVDEKSVREAVRAGVTVMISALGDAALADRISHAEQERLKVHLKIETGLNRFGLSTAEAVQVCRSLSQNPFIYIEGIYTHMAHAGARNPAYTLKQFQSFMQTVQELHREGFEIPIRHCANSAVTLRFPQMRLDAVRVGTLLSGQYPVGEMPRPVALQDPFQLKARVISIKQRPAGSSIGYFRSYRLKRAARIAVVSAGFSDGVAVDVANPPAGWLDAVKRAIKVFLVWLRISRFTAQVYIKGQPCMVAGKVFMQFTLVELPDDLEVAVGCEAWLPSKKTLVSPAVMRVHRRELGGIRAEGH